MPDILIGKNHHIVATSTSRAARACLLAIARLNPQDSKADPTAGGTTCFDFKAGRRLGFIPWRDQTVLDVVVVKDGRGVPAESRLMRTQHPHSSRGDLIETKERVSFETCGERERKENEVDSPRLRGKAAGISRDRSRPNH